MIGLRNKLYESLLGDIDDLNDISNDDEIVADLNMRKWSERFNIPLSFYNSQHKTDAVISRNNLEVKMNYLNPWKMGDYTIKELLDPGFVLKIKELHLGYGFADSNCTDLIDSNSYKHFPDDIKSLTLSFLNYQNISNIDFSKIRIKGLRELYILPKGYKKGQILDFYKLPTQKIDTVSIRANLTYNPSARINLDSINGLNCDKFIISEFTNSDGDPLINPNSAAPYAPMYVGFNSFKAYKAYDRFFEKNNVNQLIISKNTGGSSVGWLVELDTETMTTYRKNNERYNRPDAPVENMYKFTKVRIKS